MKVLLFGEYNTLHYTLKEGLETLGHEVLVVGYGDGFKKVVVDINFKVYFNKGLSKKIKIGINRLFKINITSVLMKYQFNRSKHLFKGFDVVQLINENPLLTTSKTAREIIQFLFKSNKKIYLLSCGTDYISVKYAFDKKFRYSILTPYFEEKVKKKQFAHLFYRIDSSYKKLHDYIYQNIKGIIASDLDYHLPLMGNEKYLGMVPNPINIEKLQIVAPKLSEKILIFHGINKDNYFKKGNDIFEKALEIIKKKYASKIDIVTVVSLPYKEYIQSYNNAHILLDQVYAYDQGYNALEAMAKGKVVFTGAEKEWLEYFNLKEDTVAINALPNEQKIADKLEWLILNPKEIRKISKNARAFIEKEHHYINIAKTYISKWK
ncbi:glycosyltransferase [Aestuariivivens marinum]|uniref:glycosyltransferase n=1 Tax=Aestuariivivens marinum TaxID=2913555 RepID=UPI001F570321|nr:glycosyltransferase [Aestuariivivens marinum]